MNPLESQLHYPLADQLPAGGEAIEIVTGLFWLRMPLPFALDHINLWLLRDHQEGREGWTIIDCGIASPETRAYWEMLFDTRLGGLPVLRVMVTHGHPDHIGLADWLTRGGERQRWQAPLWASQGEYLFARLMSSREQASLAAEQSATYFQQHGYTDPALLTEVRARKDYFPRLVPAVPQQYRRLFAGETLRIGSRDWRIVPGFGHSNEHCALHCVQENLLISGDMVLPRISANVSVFPLEPEGNPLACYLDSLIAYEAMSADTLVLPSHGKPFRGLHTRVAQLRAHHAQRLAEVRVACAEKPHSAADIVPRMFHRKLDTHQLSFALGEALAHLHHLWQAGDLHRMVTADRVVFKRIC